MTPSDLARGLAADGLSALLASFTNSFPDTAFAENVGLLPAFDPSIYSEFPKDFLLSPFAYSPYRGS